jgi:hypothetical protein
MEKIMTTLGERLKQIIEKDEREGLERQRVNDELARKKVAAERAALDVMFATAFEEAENSISEGRKPKGKVVKSYSMPFNYHLTAPDNEKHPYHDIYLHWVGIANANGLKLLIHHEHDGGGMEGWHRIIFWI